MTDLESRIISAKDAYYNGTPIMSDQEFDSLEEELRRQNPASKVLDIVGAPVSQNTVAHSQPMLSQAKCLTVDESIKWMRSNNWAPVVLTDKLDGISCAARYVEGKLTLALTRGDGERGTDITQKASCILPTTLLSPWTGEVRGEIILAKESFAALNLYLKSLGEESLANPRNGVSGIINEQSLRLDKLNYCDFFAYNKFEVEPTYEETLLFLEDLGFNIVPYSCTVGLHEEMLRQILAGEELLRDKKLIDVDGIVIRLNNSRVYDEQGFTSHHPRGSVAWKYPAKAVTVTIKDIIWSPGTRDISPIAVFEPTLIGGALVGKASLKSVKNMLDIGCTIGSRVQVVRSGEVIPWIKGLADDTQD